MPKVFFRDALDCILHQHLMGRSEFCWFVGQNAWVEHDQWLAGGSGVSFRTTLFIFALELLRVVSMCKCILIYHLMGVTVRTISDQLRVSWIRDEIVYSAITLGWNIGYCLLLLCTFEPLIIFGCQVSFFIIWLHRRYWFIYTIYTMFRLDYVGFYTWACDILTAMLQWYSQNMMIDDFIQRAADEPLDDLLISTSCSILGGLLLANWNSVPRVPGVTL